MQPSYHELDKESLKTGSWTLFVPKDGFTGLRRGRRVYLCKKRGNPGRPILFLPVKLGKHPHRMRPPPENHHHDITTTTHIKKEGGPEYMTTKSNRLLISLIRGKDESQSAYCGLAC